jgi:hypothetical protein
MSERRGCPDDRDASPNSPRISGKDFLPKIVYLIYSLAGIGEEIEDVIFPPAKKA